MPTQVGSSVSQPIIPSGLQNIINTGQTQLGAAQQNFPSVTGLADAPQLNIPNLTPDQQQQIQAILAAGGGSPDLAAARQQLEQLTAGPIGSSPVTQQAMQAYQQYTVPQLMQQQALAGRATGGAALEAVGLGTQQALVPLLQQEVQNRSNAVGQYGQLQGQQLQSLTAALEAAGLPREVAQQQAQAVFDQQQQQLQYEQQIQGIPLQLLPGTIGQQTKTMSHDTMGAWDYVGGAMAPLSKALSGFGGGGGGGA